jgi:hypothetical protein
MYLDGGFGRHTFGGMVMTWTRAPAWKTEAIRVESGWL